MKVTSGARAVKRKTDDPGRGLQRRLRNFCKLLMEQKFDLVWRDQTDPESLTEGKFIFVRFCRGRSGSPSSSTVVTPPQIRCSGLVTTKYADGTATTTPTTAHSNSNNKQQHAIINTPSS